MLESNMKVTARQKNILNILNYILLNEKVSAINIAKWTNLSVATVSRIFNILDSQKIIVRASKGSNGMGRNPEIISLNPTYGYYLHFYTRTENIVGYLLDFSGNVIATENHIITRDIKADDFVHCLYKLARDLTKAEKIDYKKLIATNIAIPGLVDDTKKVIRRIPNFENMRNINLLNIASDGLKLPVKIMNRARTCAIGEYIHLYPKYKNLVYIDFTSFSGIGAGIVIDGKLYTGKNGFAGEIGDMIVDISDFDKNLINDAGCLEVQAGIGILYQRLKTLMSKGRARHLKEIMQNAGVEELNLDILEKAINEMDYDVIDTFNDIVKRWAAAIINIIILTNPDLIVLGGVLDKRYEFILTRLKHYIGKILYYDVNIRLKEEEFKSHIMGGIFILKKYALNNTLKDLILTL